MQRISAAPSPTSGMNIPETDRKDARTTVFLEQLEELNRLLLQMASHAEELVDKSLDALKNQNTIQARAVILRDKEIDELELVIDRHIFNILALHQPVASDLRFILAAQKINNDLERVADHAVNIAESAIALADAPHIKPLVNIPKMAETARLMLKEAIDSFVYRDTETAVRVKQRDDEIDHLYGNVKKVLFSVIQSNPQHFYRAAHLLDVSRDLERIADLATNIAEEVVFVIKAEVMKHERLRIQGTTSR